MSLILEIIHRFGFMLVHRPYVFVPIALFFIFASREIGWVRTFLWFFLAYSIAWLSEWGSINYGFPYGFYYYVAGPWAKSEIWLLGVPFWDSVSYVFLSYWSFGAAKTLLRPSQPETGLNPRSLWKVWLLGGILMVAADVIIDPVALQGDKWFLGRVYGYPEVGFYFGVTFSNFVGWLITGLAIMGVYLFIEAKILRRFPATASPERSNAGKYSIVSPMLYIAIVSFNIFMALYIRDYLLFFCDCVVALPIFTLLLRRIFSWQWSWLSRPRPLRIR